jgi:hypothetical protein
MDDVPHPPSRRRRRLLQYLTLVGVGSQVLLRTGELRAAVIEATETAGLAAPWPEMAYRTLGRTGFRASRLVFGCGAALSSRRRDDLLDMAFDAGVNVFDVGYRHYYGAAERNLAPFLVRRRDRVFLISKAGVPIDAAPDRSVSLAEARAGAAGWARYLDESLAELGVEHIDAYYQMGANNPSIVGAEELYRAFERAKAAGKVAYYGLSTHENAERVLETAITTGWYDLVMIAVTPGGWYDWKTRQVLPGSPPMTELRPLFDRARGAGIGLVGMKAGRFLAGRRFLGWANPTAFDGHYDAKLLGAKLSEFQRAYAFVLEHGLDVVNADMQTIAHLKENFVAAATSVRYFA